MSNREMPCLIACSLSILLAHCTGFAQTRQQPRPTYPPLPGKRPEGIRGIDTSKIDIRSKKTLSGLEALRLVVVVSTNAHLEGVTQAELEAELEPRLRAAGIRVLSESEAESEAGKPTLVLSLDLRNHKPAEYDFMIQAHFREEVSPVRRGSLRVMAATWQSASLGTLRGVPDSDASRFIRSGIQAATDQFLRDRQPAGR